MPRTWSLSNSSTKDAQKRFAPAPLTRNPVGIDRLLATYDEYPHVVSKLENAQMALERADIDSQAAEDRKLQAEAELQAEKDAREQDRRVADHATEEALKKARKEKTEAEKAMEKRVRGELDPKIEDLTKKLKTMTTDRDDLKKELNSLRSQMTGWVNTMERLSKERIDREDKEAKAAEERKRLATTLRELDEEILNGLKLANKKPEPEAPVKTETKTDVKRII